MTRMLDVLEAFLNLHGHSYCRLDGSTKPEQRQVGAQGFKWVLVQWGQAIFCLSIGFKLRLSSAAPRRLGAEC